jgi:hypothetical protein
MFQIFELRQLLTMIKINRMTKYTEHNGIQHRDTEHNDIQHRDTEHNGI